MINLDNMSSTALVELYSLIIKELKKREIMRTNNFIGEIGEHLAIECYNNNPRLPNLQVAPVGTQNIDAISRAGERYSIKSTSTKTTGVFYGLKPKGASEKDVQQFEYVIICQFDKDYSLNAIYQLDWEVFLRHKKWHSRMSAWNLTLSNKLVKDSKIIYKKE